VIIRLGFNCPMNGEPIVATAVPSQYSKPDGSGGFIAAGLGFIHMMIPPNGTATDPGISPGSTNLSMFVAIGAI
jgi:hypothetical protein